MSTQWNTRYARRLQWMTTSAIRDILKFAQGTDVISLSGGWPEADLFPTEQLAELAQHALRQLPRQALQYGLTDGYPPLRQSIADMMSESGIPAKAENIAIISGSQQGPDLLGRIMLDEGDAVLIENPTFLGALQSFNAFGPRYVPISMDGDGLCVEGLEETIAREKPKFMYLIPTFQNPTGVTMSLERRRRVVEIADRQGVPILEDDPYGALRFEGAPLPTLAALDSARFPENAAAGSYVKGNVIYMGTFSKTLAPGLRVGWVVCPPEVAQQFVMAKQGADLHTNTLAQVMADEFIRRGWLPAQVQRIRDTYLERRNAMVEAIAQYFPQEIEYTRPQGGLFFWVKLPDKVDTVELLKEAVKLKVAFVPGKPFFVDGQGRSTLRLSFASVPPQVIHEGIKRLGAAIKAQLAR
jgi:2-aminoadipate transaminase